MTNGMHWQTHHKCNALASFYIFKLFLVITCPSMKYLLLLHSFLNKILISREAMVY